MKNLFGMASLVLTILAASPSVEAQTRETPGTRERHLEKCVDEIEELLVDDLPEQEAIAYAARLRQTADRFEDAHRDKSIRLSVLRNQLRRVQASMGGAVDGDGRVYEYLMMRLQRDEIRLKAQIDRLEKEIKNE